MSRRLILWQTVHMEHLELYIALFVIIATVGVLARNSTIPSSLLIVIVGMLLSFIPAFPTVTLNPDIIFNIFLPLLLYEASAYTTTWKEMKSHMRPIISLSVGHVIFITLLVATTIHYLIPELGWPLAIALGAVISPPDDVAILAVAEKIRIPTRVITVLKGEAMLNDATALIIYRFALIAFVTHEFLIIPSIVEFITIVVTETLYGFCLAVLIGELRLRINHSSLQMLISVLTPFLAYIPAASFAGSGVVATVATGLFIGNFYWGRYPPDVRLAAKTVWTSLGFCVQSILFLLVGLDFKNILMRNAYIPTEQLIMYSSAVVLAVIIGRFIWCYPAAYLPRLLIPSIRKSEPKLPWQYPFIVSWAGMRGGISLAAALAVPTLPMVDHLHPKDLLDFMVFSVIIATLLIQGLTLPWIIKLIGVPNYGKIEQAEEKRAELATRAAMIASALKWLSEYEMKAKDDCALLDEIKLRIQEYSMIEQHLRERIEKPHEHFDDDTTSFCDERMLLLAQVVEIERQELTRFWNENKITQQVKYKLEQELDLRAKRLEDYT